MNTTKPARMRRLDLIERTLDAIRPLNGKVQAGHLAGNPEWLDLSQRFADRTGMTTGRYLRTAKAQNAAIPEDVANMLREMIAMLTGSDNQWIPDTERPYPGPVRNIARYVTFSQSE